MVGFLGVVAHTLSKIISFKKDFEIANEQFVLRKYFKDDWPAVLLSMVIVLAVALFKEEVLNYKPAVSSYIKIIFFAIGALGSWLFNLLLGKTKKHIRGIIDEKTDIADKKTDT
jgi:hypothetical protein